MLALVWSLQPIPPFRAATGPGHLAADSTSLPSPCLQKAWGFPHYPAVEPCHLHLYPLCSFRSFSSGSLMLPERAVRTPALWAESEDCVDEGGLRYDTTHSHSTHRKSPPPPTWALTTFSDSSSQKSRGRVPWACQGVW